MSGAANISKTHPAYKLIPVTPSDVTVFAPTRGLYIGTAGALAIRLVDEPTTTRTITTAIAGYHPLQVVQVMAATTATDIHAIY